MKIYLFLFYLLFYLTSASAENLVFYIESAYKNNPILNAERKNVKAVKENISISRSEFLPNLSITANKTSSNSTNRTNQSGTNLSDSSSDTETKTISVDQKVFQGFQGYNSLKKSQLELKRQKLELKKVEQEIILEAATIYLDLIYKEKGKNFNLSNVDLFERQVESDSARLQKGEITLTDLAQAESSLAGAKASLITAETELLTTKTEFERIIRVEVPDSNELKVDLNIKLPKNLIEALNLAKKNSPQLLIAQLNYNIAQKDLNIEKSKLSPSASINYSKSKNDDFSATVDNVDEETVKATITWPLIKGGKNFSSIKKAKYNKEQRNLLLDDAVNGVKSSTTNAWSIYQSAESVLDSTKAQLKAAEIANEGISLEYDSGNTRTTLEVIQSRSLLLNARITKAKAERDFVISKFSLLKEIGTLSMEAVKSI